MVRATSNRRSSEETVMHGRSSSRWSEGATGDGAGCAPQFPVPVIALHCSGADGGQWRKLAAALGLRYELFAPSFIGCADIGPWTGERAFTLADEARAVIGLVDVLATPVHLVGHSYGGGVALKVASARPSAIASLTLYEPSAFHLLRQIGERGRGATAEIEAVAAAVGAGLVSGAYQAAAAHFVDYWNGAGAWAALRPNVRDALIRWLPKAPLDFRALDRGDDDARELRPHHVPGAHRQGSVCARPEPPHHRGPGPRAAAGDTRRPPGRRAHGPGDAHDGRQRLHCRLHPGRHQAAPGNQPPQTGRRLNPATPHPRRRTGQ